MGRGQRTRYLSLPWIQCPYDIRDYSFMYISRIVSKTVVKPLSKYSVLWLPPLLLLLLLLSSFHWVYSVPTFTILIHSLRPSYTIWERWIPSWIPVRRNRRRPVDNLFVLESGVGSPWRSLRRKINRKRGPSVVRVTSSFSWHDLL